MDFLSDGCGALLLAASGPPKWLWATLIMGGFVLLSALTMALTRLSVRRPPPVSGPAEEKDDPPE